MTDEQRQQGVTRVTVGSADAGQRVDNFLINRLKGVPRTRIYNLLRRGEVRVNRRRVKPVYRLVAGDELRLPPLRLPPETQVARVGQSRLAALERQVIHEDRNLLVFDKPAGLAVHGGSGVNLGLIEQLRQARPREKRLELVHRLDRDTSGCLLIAKKHSVLQDLHEQLRRSHMAKQYLALVCGDWRWPRREVDLPLAEAHRGGERFMVIADQGKRARTQFRVLERFGHATLLQVKPVTGRTHQIRVHAASQGHAIAQDEKYGDRDANLAWRQSGLKRLFLHAASISFTAPGGAEVTYESPLPADLRKVLRQLR